MPITPFNPRKLESPVSRAVAKLAGEANKRTETASPEYRYGLVNRPPSLGAVPKGYTHYDPSNQGIDGVRHGVLTYPHELSAHEVKQFELLPLTGEGGSSLELPKFPAAVLRQVEPAVSTLRYLAENLTKPYDEDIQEEEAKALKTLDIFRKYAQSKHLDAERALRELGYNPARAERGAILTAKESEEEKEVKEPAKDVDKEVKEPKSEKPSEPKTTTEIQEPAKPNEPEKPSEPSKPAVPAKPNKPSEPTKVAKN